MGITVMLRVFENFATVIIVKIKEPSAKAKRPMHPLRPVPVRPLNIFLRSMASGAFARA